MDLAAAREHVIHQVCFMCHRPVPNNNQRLLNLPAEGTQKRGHPRSGDVFTGMEGKVKSYPLTPRRNRNSSDGGNLAMAPAYLVQDGRFAAWSPGALDQRRQEQAAFVNEGDGGVQCAGFFLMSGQVTFSQRRMAFSSRSRASLSGFCGDHPIERKSLGRYR